MSFSSPKTATRYACPGPASTVSSTTAASAVCPVGTIWMRCSSAVIGTYSVAIP